MNAPGTRIVVLGGGVGGLTAARHLDGQFARRSDVEVTLVSRDNFFLLSPLLFEACSGVLELRHWPRPFVYRTLGTMAAFGHTRAAADVRGLALRGFIAWWMRRTYYLFQMPRWDTRVRIALDWTVSLFFRPALTKVDLAPEREQERRNCPAGWSPSRAAAGMSESGEGASTADVS